MAAKTRARAQSVDTLEYWDVIRGREVLVHPGRAKPSPEIPESRPVRPSVLAPCENDARYFERMLAMKVGHGDEKYPSADRHGDSPIRYWRGIVTRQWWYWDDKEKKLHLMRETEWESPDPSHIGPIFEAELSAKRTVERLGYRWGPQDEPEKPEAQHPLTEVLTEAKAQGINADAIGPRLSLEDRQMILDQLAYFGVDLGAAGKLCDAELEQLQDDTVSAAWERKQEHQPDGINNVN